jgi:hypothetical protein
VLASLSFAVEDDPPDEIAQIIGDVVESLVARDRRWIGRGRAEGAPRPTLYTSLVRYREDPCAWKDAPTILRTHSGDCKDLVAWRLAELREEGEDARCHVVIRVFQGRATYHAQILRANGTIEDPSTRMGMLQGL